MKRVLAMAAMAALMLVGIPPTGSAGPSQGGISSDNVTYLNFFPFEAGTATGMNIFGKKDQYMIVTGWKSFSIYDISNPEAPVNLSITPFGFRFENEDVATNGKIMLFSAQLPQNVLYVYDIEDKSNPVLIAELPGGGGHTMSCILKCKWAYGSAGYIIDLRDPAAPVKREENWIQMTAEGASFHDVEEYKNGFILTSPHATAFQVIDVRNPVKPKVLGLGKHPTDGAGFLFHSGHWPNEGEDRFILMQGEKNANPRCNDATGPFMTFDTKGWEKTKTFKLIDTYRVTNGTFVDGSPPANGLGCSAHWFNEHETFENGGLVAMGYYEHGTRFFNVNSKGKIKEVGWFLPFAGSTSAAYWPNEEIVYAVDYTRGIDILRYTGKV